jgi:hypothetical protein
MLKAPAPRNFLITLALLKTFLRILLYPAPDISLTVECLNFLVLPPADPELVVNLLFLPERGMKKTNNPFLKKKLK